MLDERKVLNASKKCQTKKIASDFRVKNTLENGVVGSTRNMKCVSKVTLTSGGIIKKATPQTLTGKQKRPDFDSDDEGDSDDLFEDDENIEDSEIPSSIWKQDQTKKKLSDGEDVASVNNIKGVSMVTLTAGCIIKKATPKL